MKTIWVVQYNDGTADVFDEDQGPPSWPYVDAFEAKQRIAELEEQLPKVVMPKRWVSRLGDDMFECPACHRKVKGNPYSHKACQCGAKLNWEK